MLIILCKIDRRRIWCSTWVENRKDRTKDEMWGHTKWEKTDEFRGKIIQMWCRWRDEQMRVSLSPTVVLQVLMVIISPLFCFWDFVDPERLASHMHQPYTWRLGNQKVNALSLFHACETWVDTSKVFSPSRLLITIPGLRIFGLTSDFVPLKSWI